MNPNLKPGMRIMTVTVLDRPIMHGEIYEGQPIWNLWGNHWLAHLEGNPAKQFLVSTDLVPPEDWLPPLDSVPAEYPLASTGTGSPPKD